MPSDYLPLSEQAWPFMVGTLFFATNSTGRLAITQSLLDLLAFLGNRNRPSKTLHVLHLWTNVRLINNVDVKGFFAAQYIFHASAHQLHFWSHSWRPCCWKGRFLALLRTWSGILNFCVPWVKNIVKAPLWPPWPFWRCHFRGPLAEGSIWRS